MGEFETREWRRYGKDRTYVIDAASGMQIGYRDNSSGALVPSALSTTRVLSRWAESAVEASEIPEPPLETPLPLPVDSVALASGGSTPLGDEDLSGRRAGSAARARALEELDARKARSGTFLTWLGRVFDVRTDERAWRIGADAEETIGRELERLTRHGWKVLHSVPVGSGESDIDHVLIGPPGVFTVNSKHHPGASVWVVPRQVRVNNQPVPYLRNSRHEAARAARLLSAASGVPVTATAVLIFRLGSGALRIREHPGDVLVYRARQAYKPLRRLPSRLTSEQVDRLYDAARWRSTWQPR